MREWVVQYKEATIRFLAVAEALSSSELDKSDKEGWTPRQVIHHMADSEAQSYARLRRLIAEPGTVIQGYDEGAWAQNPTLGYTTESVDGALAVIRAVRESSYRLLVRLSETHLDNSGIHSESGNYSVRTWIETYTKHPLEHASQIQSQIQG